MQPPADPPRAIAWNDYICPWAYAARPRTDWLRSRGVTIDLRFYELHPGIGPAGRTTKPGGRLDHVFDHLASECESAGLPFVKPSRTPNSRRCLELMEVVRAHHPSALLPLDQALAGAHWVKGLPLDDPEVLAELMAQHLEPVAAEEVADRLGTGEGGRLLDRSREDAHDVGVTATPAWRLGELTITGLHAPEQFERWAGRVLGLG